MSFAAERAAIETRFAQQWMDGGAPRTPIGWDGQPFDPPESGPSVRLTIVNGQGLNKSMGTPGTNIVRHSGVVMIQIFSPSAGTAPIRELLDHLEPIFTNWRSGQILFRSMSVSSLEVDPPFRMMTASFPFQRDAFTG